MRSNSKDWKLEATIKKLMENDLNLEATLKSCKASKVGVDESYVLNIISSKLFKKIYSSWRKIRQMNRECILDDLFFKYSEIIQNVNGDKDEKAEAVRILDCIAKQYNSFSRGKSSEIKEDIEKKLKIIAKEVKEEEEKK